MILTILNTLAILVIFFKLKIIEIHTYGNKTFWNKTLTGYDVWLIFFGKKFYFKIPIKNHRKAELSEEVQRMIATYSQQDKLQTLSAKFSWLKTWEDVRQFEKDYSVVDRKIVERLVSEFKPK